MIYFDTPRDVDFRGRKRRSTHLFSHLRGEDGTNELLAFGLDIRMKPAWLQHRGMYKEHFDLFDGKIYSARQAGAFEVTPRRMIELMLAKKEP